MASIILASSSKARQAMLAAAGVAVSACPAAVDETAIKRHLTDDGATTEAAVLALATAKAFALARPDALIIAADQILECEGVWYDKPVNRTAAKTQLLALRGKAHRLVTGVVVTLGSRRLWQHCETARLVMRPFTDRFLEDYLDRAGDALTQSVGAYHLEGLGAQLFSCVEGDYFTILGLPLLPLLDFLRGQGVLEP